MEIKSVKNEVKNEYPKIEQVSKKHLKSKIPNKWLKVGMSSLVIAMITQNKALATSNADINFNSMDIAGGVPVAIPMPIEICIKVCPIVEIISIVMFIITGLNILITKIKSKKQNENKKVKKWVKVIFVISIIVFILSIITKLILNNRGYATFWRIRQFM